MNRRRCVPVPPGSTTTRTLHPQLRPVADAFIRALRTAGFQVTVTSTLRDESTQAALYDNYRRGCSTIPAAAPGKSRHGFGRAFDLRLVPPRYDLAGRYWESIGGTWGGRFNDPIHFEA